MTKIAQILVNMNCNLACDYCYERHFAKVNDTQNIDIFLQDIIQRTSKTDNKAIVLDFIGGEPFMYPHIMRASIESAQKWCKQYGVRLKALTVSTNGTLFSKKHKAQRQLIADYKKLWFIGLSIDGTKEKHDLHRIYKRTKDGQTLGSYDDAVRDINWLKTQVCFSHQVNCKATFIKDDFKKYFFDSFVNLVNLGFKKLNMNMTYEEIKDPQFGVTVASETMRIVDYIMDSNLQNDINWEELQGRSEPNYTYKRLKNYQPESNKCGSGTNMECIGFDGKVYGCNRFCSMNKEDKEVAQIKNQTVQVVNIEAIQERAEAWKNQALDCSKCSLNRECADCIAVPEDEGISRLDYNNQKRMCGWTHGLALAKAYYQDRLENQ